MRSKKIGLFMVHYQSGYPALPIQAEIGQMVRKYAKNSDVMAVIKYYGNNVELEYSWPEKKWQVKEMFFAKANA